MSSIDYAALRMLASSNDGDPEWNPEVVMASAELNALLDELERLRAMETEVEWEVQTVIVGQDGGEWDEVRAESIPDARDDIKTWLASNDLHDGESIVIRTRRKPGPWVPVPEQNPERKGSEL